LLGERQCERSAPFDRRKRRQRCFFTTGTGPLNDGAQRLDRRPFKKASKRQLDLEGGPDAGNDLRREQRMTAQFEEIVVNADMLHPEDLGPDPGQNFFNRGARSIAAG